MQPFNSTIFPGYLGSIVDGSSIIPNTVRAACLALETLGI